MDTCFIYDHVRSTRKTYPDIEGQGPASFSSRNSLTAYKPGASPFRKGETLSAFYCRPEELLPWFRSEQDRRAVHIWTGIPASPDIRNDVVMGERMDSSQLLIWLPRDTCLADLEAARATIPRLIAVRKTYRSGKITVPREISLQLEAGRYLSARFMLDHWDYFKKAALGSASELDLTI